MSYAKNIVSLNNVTKTYPKNKLSFFFKKKYNKVFENLNFCFQEKQIVGIYGPNGSGKTTLIKLIAGLYLPSHGTITINGKSTLAFNAYAKKAVGVNLNSERSFFWHLTGQQNIDFLSSLNAIRHNKSYRDNIIHKSSILNINNMLNQRVSNYSIGMREKLGYLLSFIYDSQILIYDDFGKNLDSQSLVSLGETLKTMINQGKQRLIILASPRLESLRPLATKLLCIKSNKLQEMD